MASYNNHESYSREIQRQRQIQNNSGNDSPVENRKPEAVRHHAPHPQNIAYRDGYVQGRVSEQRIREEQQIARDNENAARGLLVGILFTGLAALTVGAIFLLNQRNQPPVIIQRQAPVASPSPSPQVRDRIIERDRLIPVPQPQPPQVNITVPNSQPVAPPATQTVPDASTTQTAPSGTTDGTQTGTTGTGQTGTSTTGQ